MMAERAAIDDRYRDLVVGAARAAAQARLFEGEAERKADEAGLAEVYARRRAREARVEASRLFSRVIQLLNMDPESAVLSDGREKS